MKNVTIILLLIFSTVILSAQRSNDECANAMEISDIANWCSNTASFSNNGATISADPKPGCFNTSGTDVWYTFVSTSTSINIRVLGDIVDIYGVTVFSQGTLREPSIALYQGDCGSLTLVECNQDEGDHIAEMFSDQLIPNARYYIRVSSAAGDQGNFQMCISSFNFIPEPNSDCVTGVVLCDKSSFFVDALTGTGNEQNEVEGSCVQEEFASAWYKWVAGNNGRLTFEITPNNPGDDLDWALYELPNGLTDCDGKILLRCNASGANGETPFGGGFNVNPIDAAYPDGWRDCTGPTGLLEGDLDQVEWPGCHTGEGGGAGTTIDNNFVSPIDMEEGKVYALIINNFSQTGHGFSLSFGGTAEFLGPEADFTTDDLDGTVCWGDPVSYFDASSFGSLNLIDWQWNFGEGAMPQTANGPGPHRIDYSVSGIKSIALTVKSETGCLTTTIGQIIVEAPYRIEPAINHVSCPGMTNGSINLNITSGSTVSSISWNNGMTGTSISGLEPGTYEAQIINFNGCDTFATFIVESPEPLEINSIITQPSCNQQSDGSITVDIIGQAPPFQYNWYDGLGPIPLKNTLINIPAGIYPLSIIDNNGCQTDTTLLLNEFDALIGPTDPVTEPTCFGFSDGRIDLDISGGISPYSYNWHPTDSTIYNNFVDTPYLTGISAGVYLVGIEDAVKCRSFLSFEVGEPPELSLLLDTQHISCFGEQDGMLTPLVSGGTGRYIFNWVHGPTDSLAMNLGPGNYTISVTDANGCTMSQNGLIIEPRELSINIDSTRDVICFGDKTGAIFLNGMGGNPPYEFSLDGINFGPDIFFDQLGGGMFSLFVRDSRGCSFDISSEIFQPDPLIVDAGLDTSIDLGFQGLLLATHSPPLKPVDFNWNPAGLVLCDTCPSTIAGPVTTTTFTITITDDDLCTAIDSVTVFVFLNRPVFVPNSITPNGDGLNDRLGIFAGPAGRSIRKIQIFDRWGEMVYEGNQLPLNDDALGWDGSYRGQPLNPGVFVYVAEVEFIDDSVLQLEGDITLVR